MARVAQPWKVDDDYRAALASGVLAQWARTGNRAADDDCGTWRASGRLATLASHRGDNRLDDCGTARAAAQLHSAKRDDYRAIRASGGQSATTRVNQDGDPGGGEHVLTLRVDRRTSAGRGRGGRAPSR